MGKLRFIQMNGAGSGAMYRGRPQMPTKQHREKREKKGAWQFN